MEKKKRASTNRGYEDDYSLISRGKAYQPFIVIQDVPSLGRSSRPCGIKTGRQHDFLSDLEDWPCSYVPEAIIADRGEMEGYGVKNLINNLNISLFSAIWGVNLLFLS